MPRSTSLCLTFVMLVTLATLTACQGRGLVAFGSGQRGPAYDERPAPPAHAPAHGRRQQQYASAPSLRFDASLGVHVVLGETDVYFDDGLYLRMRSGVWEMSASLSGPWQPQQIEKLPPGLQKKHHAQQGGPPGHAKGRRKAKDSGPAKGKPW